MESLKEYIHRKNIKQVEISKDVGIPLAPLNTHINGWTTLPSKYEISLCDYLNIDYDKYKIGVIEEISKHNGPHLQLIK